PLVLVTAQARLVALLHREEGAGLEVVDRQLLVAAARMPCAGAVAGLALQAAAAEGRARVAAVGMTGLEDAGGREGRRVAVGIVAAETGVGALGAVLAAHAGRRCARGLGRRRCGCSLRHGS